MRTNQRPPGEPGHVFANPCRRWPDVVAHSRTRASAGIDGHRADAALPGGRTDLRHETLTLLTTNRASRFTGEDRTVRAGIGGRYSHVSATMVDELIRALTDRWLSALDARLAMRPTSPVAVLDRLLQEHRARGRSADAVELAAPGRTRRRLQSKRPAAGPAPHPGPLRTDWNDLINGSAARRLRQACRTDRPRSSHRCHTNARESLRRDDHNRG